VQGELKVRLDVTAQTNEVGRTSAGAASAALTGDYQAVGVRKHFGGVVALRDANMTLTAGKVTALVGDNGAGKSTFAKILCGAESCTGGDLLLDDKRVHFGSTRDAQARGIQMVFQDLALCDNLDTVQNIFLGRELYTPWYMGRALDRPAMEQRSRALATELGIRIRDLSAPIRGLSGGERQGVAITRAVLSDPTIVLLDEPTAALGVEKRTRVREIIVKLRERGCAVMLISHDLAEVEHLADTVVVLRLGETVAQLHRGEYDGDELVARITGAKR
jgi:D-xylose transport system ATP-binding protein